MNPLILSGASAVSSNIADAFSSVSRIVESNNWRDAELFAIKMATEVACNRVKGKSKVDKAAIDFCFEQTSEALKSKKLTSAQKREVFIAMTNKMLSI
jgi:hypothetical protein